MYPILFMSSDGLVIISSHDAIMGLAYIVGIIYSYLKWKQVNGNTEYALTFLYICFFATFIGGKLMVVMEHPQYFLDHPLEALKIWKSGYGSWGSWVVTLLAGGLFLKYKGFNVLKMMDVVIVPTGMLAQGVGRFACLLGGDIYGSVTTLPWGITYSDPVSGIPKIFLNIPLHPLPLYMALSLFFAFFLSIYLRYYNLKDGSISFLTLTVYALLYFGVELFRAHPNIPAFVGDFSSPQATSLVVFTLSVIGLIFVQCRKS